MSTRILFHDSLRHEPELRDVETAQQIEHVDHF